jgi:hypothetical protein
MLNFEQEIKSLKEENSNLTSLMKKILETPVYK